MDTYRTESLSNLRRGPGPDGTWQQERSDSGWSNLSAFAALTRDGQVIAWGDPASGGSLDGDLSSSSGSVDLPPLGSLTRPTGSTNEAWIWTVELASSRRAFAARRANGEVLAWGDPAAGGTIPTELREALSRGVVRVFGLAQGFAALKPDGTLITWGAGPGSSIQATTLDPSQPYRLVTSIDSLAILQGERLVGCWGGGAGASQWRQYGALRDAVTAGVQELVCNDAGFAARTASGQVITWGAPEGIGNASGMSISSRPDVVRLGSDAYEFHGFDAKGRIRLWTGLSGQYQAGENYIEEPLRKGVAITGAMHAFRLPGGGISWIDDSDVLQAYRYQPSSRQIAFIPYSDQAPTLGRRGLVVIDQGGDLQTSGYDLDQPDAPSLDSPNSTSFFSPNANPNAAFWTGIRSSGGAFAALGSNGRIGLWGDAASGASPANPKLTQQLLESHPARSLYSNSGAFTALAADGTAISWGAATSGGDQDGTPQVFQNLHHLVSPWENVRIDELGPGLLRLLANGQPNPDGQATPIRVREGDRLTAVISSDPNGDRSDTTGNVYLWQRNGTPAGDSSQSSVNLDALSTGLWSLTPTYRDLPGFQKTLTPLSVQVEQVDNGQATVQISPYSFSGTADQAFSAGNGKVAELVATLSGDPEGIRSIEAVQWFRNGAPIASFGTPQRSILAATEPGNYSFEATYTDSQGYRSTVRSGRLRIDPAGSVPTQSRLATGGLQTLWRLSDDGRSVERFDSSSLRMRPVDMAGSSGYLAISAASDGRTWALDNEGYACAYDRTSNRFLRQDGSGSGAEQRLDLGSGWRQIVVARGSSTAPGLWLLRDAPLDGSSNVAYLPGALAQGQTLADLKPITVADGPQLRLLAVGDDQTPWGLDEAGDLWRWDASNKSFSLLAEGVGGTIRQLQMVDQGQVWGLDDQGVLQMWDGTTNRFKPVPVDSPFFTRHSELLSAGGSPTWESFSLSPLGGFVGIPRSGVTLPAGGNGLVAFDTSEIAMLRDPSENPSQLQLISGETLQDNGVRQQGQNLAFNLNDQINVTYLLNGSQPGQWEGAAVVPKAQSGADLRLEPGPNRDEKGTRLPVLKLSWLGDLGQAGQQAYGSLGYVSPFGGLVFSPAAEAASFLSTQSNSSALSQLSYVVTNEPSSDPAEAPSAESGESDEAFIDIPFGGSPFTWAYPNRDGRDLPGALTNKFSDLAAWKALLSVSFPGASTEFQPKPSSATAYLSATLEFFKSYSTEFTTEQKEEAARKHARDKEKHREIGQRYWERADPNDLFDTLNAADGYKAQESRLSSKLLTDGERQRLESISKARLNRDTSIEIPIQLAYTYNFLDRSSKLSWCIGIGWTKLWSPWVMGNWTFQIGFGFDVEYLGETTLSSASSQYQSQSDSSNLAVDLSAKSPESGFTSFIDGRSEEAATVDTPIEFLTVRIDPDYAEKLPFIKPIANALPVVDLVTGVLIPAIEAAVALATGPSGGLATAREAPISPPLATQIALQLQQADFPDLLGSPLQGSAAPSPELASAPDLESSVGIALMPIFSFRREKLTSPLRVNITIEPEFSIPKLYIPPEFDLKWFQASIALEAEFALLMWSFPIDIAITLIKDGRLIGSGDSSVSSPNAEVMLLGSADALIRRDLNTHLLAEDAAISTSRDQLVRASSEAVRINPPVTQLVRSNGEAIGIITRLLPGNTGLFELCWVKGKQRADNLSIDWDVSSIQRIDGSAGATANIQLIERQTDGSVLLPGQHLKAGEYLLSNNGQFMASMQDDGNFVVQTPRANGTWAVSFSLNDYRDAQGNQPIANVDNPNIKLGSTPGTRLELRDGKLCFINDSFKTATGSNAISIENGSYLRGYAAWTGFRSHSIHTANLPHGATLSELRLGDDGVLRATANDGTSLFSFDPYFEFNDLSTKPIGSDQRSGLTLKTSQLLAVSASHLGADDPLLRPITRLAPGTVFRVDAAPGALGSGSTLSDATPQLGLPAERVWAQLGSSLTSTGALRSGWSGDSLIAGASGSNDGAGALYILNGRSLPSLSDLSALERNTRPDQGLVILGSHQGGSLSGLGQLVVNGGDTNADGFSEILASAPNDQGGAGLVYMLYGGRALELLPTVKSGSIDLDNLDALQANPLTRDQFLLRFSGVSGSSGYGTILAGGRDLNGDGLSDPLIGYAADSVFAGSVELWSSRSDLRRQTFLGLEGSGQQTIPHFDRSIFVSDRSPLVGQSNFDLHAATAVNDLNADGYGEIALSSDSQVALVFGDRLMPVYWEASSILGSISTGDAADAAATSTRTWTASWSEADGRRLVLSFCGRDADGDGRLSTGVPNEIDWLALRVDSPVGEPMVALSGTIAARWLGALTFSDASLSFDLNSGTFTAPVRLEAGSEESSFSWASDRAGVSLDQAPRALRARLITSNAPGVLNAAGISDFNGDGMVDLALSQAGYRIPNSDITELVFQPGQTAVLFGDRDLASSGMPLAVEQAGTGSTGVLLDAGGELSAIGDWNADGKADLLIRDAAASGSGGAEQAGRQVLLLGRTASGSLSLDLELQAVRAQLLQGSNANSRSGTGAAAGDFAGDGGRSLFIGAPNTIRESDLRQAAAGMRLFTATQNSDGSWKTPQRIPLPEAANLQGLSSFTAVAERILATWVRTTSDGQGGGLRDELWAAFQNADGQWQPASLLQTNRRQDATENTLAEVKALALPDAPEKPKGRVLLAWTCLDPATGRSFLFQSTYAPATGWSQAQQQDLQALLLANQDALSGSQLKLELNPGTLEQRSQVWAEAGISSEGEASARITLIRAGDLSQPLTLNYSTRDQSAAAGSLYQHSRGTVQFAAGAASLSLSIPLLDNGNLEYRNTSFAVDFSLPDDQFTSARPQLLLGDTPVAHSSGRAILSVSAGVQDNDVIRMRAIDAGISLLGPLTGSTGEAAAASTNQNLRSSIALVADPGARDGLGQVYALFVAASSSSAANPGMDWKELDQIDSLAEPVASQAGSKRQLNVLIQPDAALTALDPREGFGTAMVKLTVQGQDHFAISAPGNPLDGSKSGRVFLVAASTIQAWADSSTTASQPLILNERNSLIIEEVAGGLFGSALAAADLDADTQEELIVGAPGSASVHVIKGTELNRKGSQKINSLSPWVIRDQNTTTGSGSSGFGSAITTLDLDADQHLDLAIGAPRALPVRARTAFSATGPIVANAGAVYVIQGSGSLSNSHDDVTALLNDSRALILKGQKRVNPRSPAGNTPRLASDGLQPPGSFGFGEELGSSLAAMDLNNDGHLDLAMGGPQYTPDDTVRTGRVVTWFGGGIPRWGNSIDLSTLSAAQGVSFVGQQEGGRVGASLAPAGDLQGDNNQDLAIGAPFEDGGNGRVYVAFGSQNRYGTEALNTTGNSFALDSTSPDSPFQTFEAPAGYQLGQSVVGLGDVNNDSLTGIGGADLFLGSPTAIAPREGTNDKGDLELIPAGQAQFAWGRPWLGPNQSLDVPFTQGVGYLLPFGGVPLALGDLDGDGYGDYALLGESNDWLKSDPAQQADAGRLRIRFGAAVEYEQRQLLLSNFDLRPARTPLSSDQMPLVVTGDFDGDGFGDVIASTKAGLKLLSGAPNLSLQGDANTRWDTTGLVVSFSGGGDPISQLASGDFNGDGFDDLVVVCQNTALIKANPTLTILWGSASGLRSGGQKTLESSPRPEGKKPGIDGLIALDSNGDGIDELALYGNDLGTIWQLSSDRGWGLQVLSLDPKADDPFRKAVQSFPIGTGINGVPTALSSGDLDGDGLADLLIDHGGNSLSLLTGDQKAYLKPSSLTLGRSQAAQAGIQRTQLARFIGDVNGDGHDDLLFSPTSPSPLRPDPKIANISVPQKYGPYSFVYLGSTVTVKDSVTVPNFWDEEGNSENALRDLSSWSLLNGYAIESLPGEADPYRTGSIGDVNGDGFDEMLFSNNSLYVNGQKDADQRPHSIATYGSNRLTPTALASTTSNDGSSSDDTLHQLGSAGKEELLLRGKAGSDLLQVHTDPYGATLSIPNDGSNAGRLTVSASNGTTLWSQPRNSFELALRDGRLQIIRTKDGTTVKSWGDGSIDRLYLSTKGWLYLLEAKNATFNKPDNAYTELNDNRDFGQQLPGMGVAGLAGWFENAGLLSVREAPTATAGQSQLVFSPETGALYLVNRQDQSKNGDSGKDLWLYNGLEGYKNGFDGAGKTPISWLDNGGEKTRNSHITLFKGDDQAIKLITQPTLTQVLDPGESLLSKNGATLLKQPAIETMDAMQVSRQNLATSVGSAGEESFPLSVRRTSTVKHDRPLDEVLAGTSMAPVKRDDVAWATPPLQQAGPYLAVMDGNGRLTINAQQLVEGQIKPGSELAVLHEGNPDPFLPPLGSLPVQIRPEHPTDQVSQRVSRSTNNSFGTVLLGGLDDDRLGIDSLEHFRSNTGHPAGLLDGGPGVDTLFFSSQRSSQQDRSINLVGFGSRIRNIEAIEIPINNNLEIDEAPLLNTPLHRLKLESRGTAAVAFHVRTAYESIGDQLDAGLAYSVYAKPDSNLQLWVQQGRVTLTQHVNSEGSSLSLASRHSAGGESLGTDNPIDADGLAMDPAYAYRWYRDGRLIAGATQPSYGKELLQSLEPGTYVRETDYTDRSGLRQTVVSARIGVEPDQAVAGGTLRVRRSQLDARQRDQLAPPGDGLQPWPELLYLDFQAESSGAPARVQRLTLQPPAAGEPGSGLVALLRPDGTAVTQAGLYDLDANGRVDSLTWLPGEGSGGSSLEVAVLRATTPAALATQNNDLGFLLPGDSRLPALQSLRISLAAAPEQVTSLVAIPLGEDETVEDLTPAERRQRALTLLSNQDATPAPLEGLAERQRSLWLRTDQRLALLELQESTPQDWDGSSGWRRLAATPTEPGGAASLQFRASSGLVVNLSVETSAQDLNGLLARSQTSAPVLDFRGLDGLQLSGILNLAREAEYNSRVGFYAIDSLDGAIRDPITQELVAPGDSGYVALAMARRVDALDGLQSANHSSSREAVRLEASQLLAPYAVVQDPQLGAANYFAFAAANPDGRSHFRSFGTNAIGLEDQAGGGDNDFDDLLLHLKMQPLV